MLKVCRRHESRGCIKTVGATSEWNVSDPSESVRHAPRRIRLEHQVSPIDLPSVVGFVFHEHSSGGVEYGEIINRYGRFVMFTGQTGGVVDSIRGIELC